MDKAILVINCGSSSVKFALYRINEEDESPRLSYRGLIGNVGRNAYLRAADASGKNIGSERDEGELRVSNHEHALTLLLDWINAHAGDMMLVAAGHRVVHGGENFSVPVFVDCGVLADLEGLVRLAPLHQPHNLVGIRAIQRAMPNLPQIACFDTAFHRSQPPIAQMYALPRRFTEAGIRRYGFHGLSYEHIAQSAPQFLGTASAGRIIVAHLGYGCSMCAMKEHKSVATTMGFTALDGLVMGSRCGSLDPGVILHLMTGHGMSAIEVSDLLYHQSGLLGVSGISGDMLELEQSNSGHAAEAIALFVYRAGRELGSLAAALGGLDALIFTGGIGEHSAAARKAVCMNARWLGVILDDDANLNDSPKISASESQVSVCVIPTNEELVIARHVADLLSG